MSEENFPTYNFQIDLSKLLIHSGSPSPLYDEGCGNRGQPNSPPPTSDAGGDKIKSLVDLSYSLPSPASFLSKSQCQNATSINSKDRKANSASVTTSTTTNSPMASDCDQPIFLYNTLPPSFNNKMQQSTFDKSFLSEEAKQAAANIKDTMAVIAGRRQMFFEEPSHPVSFCSPSRTLPASSSSSSSSLKHQSNNISASLRGSLASNTNSSTTVATTTSTSVPSPLAALMHQSPADCKSSTRLSLKNVDLMKNCPPLEIYTTSPVLSPTKRNFSPSFYSPPPNSSSPTTTSQQVIFHFQENSSTAKSIGTSTTGGNTNSNLKSNNNSHMARQEVSTQRFEHCHLNTEVLSHYRPVSEDVPRHELVTCNHNADKVLKDSDEVVHFHSAPEPIIANSCLILSSDALLEEDVESAPSTPKTLQTLSASMKGSSKPNKFFPDSPITLTSDLGDGHAIIATGEELASLDCDSKKSSESKRASSKTEKKTKKGTSRLTQTVTHTSTNTSTQTFTHTSSGKNSPLSKHKKSPSSKDSNQKESWKGRMARTIKRYGSSSILLNNDADTKAHKGVFGAPLDTLQPSTADPLVPLIVEVCVKIIEEKGLDNQGLYRVPGNTGALKELQEDIDKDEKGLCVESDKWQDVNLVTSLLKLFFRKIPDPLITDDLYNAVIESTRVEKSERRMLKLKKLLHELPERNFNTFRYICKHLSLVSRHEENNKMDAHNLAIMFGPTLIRPHDNNIAVMARNMADQCRIVETIISNCDWFFSSWDEDVNVPDDGSGDINNAIDESMVAKAQNLDQNLYKSFSALSSLSSPSLSSSSSSYYQHHVLPFITLPPSKQPSKMSSFLKSANNLRHNSLLSRKHPSRTPTTTEHHSLPLSKSLNQRETPLKKATHSSSSITRHCSIAGMKQASSDASLVCRSRGFLGRLTRKPLTVTKSAESGMSELGVGSGTSDDSAASVEPGEVLLSEPALIFSPGVPINLKINLTNNLPSGDSSFNAGVGDASHKRLISSKTNSKLQRGKLRNSNNKPVDPVVFVCDLAVASPQPMNSNNNNINDKRNINNNTKGSNTSYSTPSNNTTSTAAAEAGKSATTKSKMSSTSAVTGLVRLPKYRLNPHNYMLADNR